MVQSPPLEKSPVTGDRVRVVLEGEAVAVLPHRLTLRAVSDGRSVNIFGSEDDPNPCVVSVEVLAKPVKVGDTISGEQAYIDLPPHSVIDARNGVLVKLTDGRWFDSHRDEHYETLTLGRKLVYLP